MRLGIHAALSTISHMTMGEGLGHSRPVAQGQAPSVARQLQDIAPQDGVLVTHAVRGWAPLRRRSESRAWQETAFPPDPPDQKKKKKRKCELVLSTDGGWVGGGRGGTDTAYFATEFKRPPF